MAQPVICNGSYHWNYYILEGFSIAKCSMCSGKYKPRVIPLDNLCDHLEYQHPELYAFYKNPRTINWNLLDLNLRLFMWQARVLLA